MSNVAEANAQTEHDFTCEYILKDASARGALPHVRHGVQNKPRPPSKPPIQQSPYVPIAAAPIRRTSTLSEPSSSHHESTVRLEDDANSLHGKATGSRNTIDEGDSLGDVNRHTQGTEFYGPMGIFPFLSKLRSRARSQLLQQESREDGHDRNDMSIVNLLHSSDYPVEKEGERRFSVGSQYPRTFQGARYHDSDVRYAEPGAATRASFKDVEREFARLYFQNLHNVHPILDPAAFLTRCEKEVWSRTAPNSTSYPQRRFLALYNAVLAIGAITAGEESEYTWKTQSLTDQIGELEALSGIEASPSTYTPLRFARVFFERAKSYVGDVFESSCFESAQTLLLLSVFCQNALKPHSCYMYSGMASRTALAIGLTSTSSESEPASLLWWALYSHEIEMCASAGRESALKDRSCYRIPLPHGPTNNSGRDLIVCMVELAELLNELSNDIYRDSGHSSMSDRSARALALDKRLEQWKDHLPPQLNFNQVSLKEPEAVTKQKIVLKLRTSHCFLIGFLIFPMLT